jgi:hypothetical protein
VEHHLDAVEPDAAQRLIAQHADLGDPLECADKVLANFLQVL